MTAPLRRVLLGHARDAFGSQEKIDREWRMIGFTDRPDYRRAVAEYDAFVEVLAACGVEPVFMPPAETTLDAIYVHDPCVTAHDGVILGRMGKPTRRKEPAAVQAFFEAEGVPILGAVEGPGLLEGGDVVWLDERTVAVGEGYRTNAEGIRQLRELLGQRVDEVIPVSLPHWNGFGGVLHLMSLLSPVDDRLAVAYSRLLPVPFRQLLIQRGITLIEVPDDEFDTLGCNVLAVAPRRTIMAEGNPRTQALLEQAGVEVFIYPADNISRKGEGGPTCLTRPLLRETA